MFLNKGNPINYSIEFYGGFANNLQQIALAIMYSKKYKKNIFIQNHELVDEFKLINNNSFLKNISPLVKKRFFYFGSKLSNNFLVDPPIEFNDFDFYHENFHKTLKNIIKPNINFLRTISISPKDLVIHIRKMEGHPDYVQNPINYYKKLFEIYENIILVTDAPDSVLVKKLSKLKKLEIQSSTLENDFNTLFSAYNLATSGVGTFAIAAAMLSDKLTNIFYSNFYLDRHLNPSMLTENINKQEYEIKNYLGYGNWNKSSDILNETLLSTYSIKSKNSYL